MFIIIETLHFVTLWLLVRDSQTYEPDKFCSSTLITYPYITPSKLFLTILHPTQSNEIDLDALLLMSEKDFSEIGLPQVLYSTALYCTILYFILLYCNALYCTIQYCAVLYCNVLYGTIVKDRLFLWVLTLWCMLFVLILQCGGCIDVVCLL